MLPCSLELILCDFKIGAHVLLYQWRSLNVIRRQEIKQGNKTLSPHIPPTLKRTVRNRQWLQMWLYNWCQQKQRLCCGTLHMVFPTVMWSENCPHLIQILLVFLWWTGYFSQHLALFPLKKKKSKNMMWQMFEWIAFHRPHCNRKVWLN